MWLGIEFCNILLNYDKMILSEKGVDDKEV